MGALLQECWRVSENKSNDSFVGIQINEKGTPNIVFPVGFGITERTSDEELRRDVILLMRTLLKYENSISQKMFDFSIGGKQNSSNVFAAYYRVIRHYMEYGYYRDTEIVYKRNGRGAISWSKTIKKMTPLLKELSAYYLNFITKNRCGDIDSLIYKINKYCVQESVKAIGWLFPRIPFATSDVVFNKVLFESTLLNKMQNTFDDEKLRLFKDMLIIINGKNNSENHGNQDLKIGTGRFEYVWEKMIDDLFGISNKREYFPKASWIIGTETIESSFLRPDTIVTAQDSIYILDAKYYKFGTSNQAQDLPGTSSINKQITYGEYAESLDICKKKKIYNFFFLPSNKTSSDNYSCVGYAISDWKTDEKKGTKTYHKVYAILADVKIMMQNYVINNEREKQNMIGKLDMAIKE